MKAEKMRTKIKKMLKTFGRLKKSEYLCIAIQK